MTELVINRRTDCQRRSRFHTRAVGRNTQAGRGLRNVDAAIAEDAVAALIADRDLEVIRPGLGKGGDGGSAGRFSIDGEDR